MKITAPLIESRRTQAILERLKILIPLYTPEWDPQNDENDVGLTLLRLLAGMLDTIGQQLNKTPAKHFAAFLDTLGIGLLPAQPARAPVTFTLAEGVKTHVLIPARTQVAADKVIFETEKTILATPARLLKIYGVDEQADQMFTSPLPLPIEKGFTPFTGTKEQELQEHSLYIGHKDLLNVKTAVTLTLTISPWSSALADKQLVKWQYWSENPNMKVLDWQDLTIFSGKQKVSSTEGELVLKKTTHDELKEFEINNIKNRWIRCIVKPSQISQLLGINIETIGLAIAPQAEGIPPDMAFYNDMPLEVNKEFYPFGKTPRTFDTFYFACKDAFSKKKAIISIDITATLGNGGTATPTDLLLSWEYWNGKGWIAINLTEGGVYQFSNSTTDTNGTKKPITFTCPTDIEKTVISGQENYWIRVRIVNGNYGKEEMVNVPGTPPEIWRLRTDQINPPVITKMTIGYGYESKESPSVETCVSYNNLEFQKVSKDHPVFYPLNPKPDENHKTLYLGFDARLESGPISLFVDVVEPATGQPAPRQVAWEYWSQNQMWVALDVLDNTQGLTRAGAVELLFPPDFIRTAKFGRELYWLRAVDRENQIQTKLTLNGIYLNTTVAVQSEHIAQEMLGASDGSANKTFRLARRPVFNAEIWVNEFGVVSTEEQAQLGADTVLETRDAAGKLTELWVRWQQRDDLLESNATDRHYTLDPTSGEIAFGEGVHGLIPPIPGQSDPTARQGNIRAAYQTGGGKQGNVAAAAMNMLKSAVLYVDHVSNPKAAEGGADPETLDAVFERGPYLLKHRDRAVTTEDFERLAKAASSFIARAKCVPNKGIVQIVIIPYGAEAQPKPSPALRRNVQQYLLDRSLNTVPPGCIQVIEPQYAEVRVTATVAPTALDIAAPLEQEINRRLNAFLHPLTGGTDEQGWEFGRAVHLSDVYALLEGIKGVDHVAKLTLNEQETSVAVAPEKTVCAGTHRITMKM